MTENFPKGLVSELIEILKLVTIFAVRKMNLQHVLYCTAFLTFGIGDGITGAYMMEKYGAGLEFNLIPRYFFMTQGFDGMVMAKVWFTVVILFATYIVQLKSPDGMYWTVNGFLVALTAGGLMAVNANLTILAGEIPQASGEIIFTYLAMMLALTGVGNFVDRSADNPENLRN